MLGTDSEPATPKRDWSAALDLDRSTAIRNFVDRMEDCLRSAETARDDLKEVVSDANEAEFTKRDVEAMKKVAQLRLKDQVGRAKEQLSALERVGRACNLDLFDDAG